MFFVSRLHVPAVSVWVLLPKSNKDFSLQNCENALPAFDPFTLKKSKTDLRNNFGFKVYNMMDGAAPCVFSD